MTHSQLAQDQTKPSPMIHLMNISKRLTEPTAVVSATGRTTTLHPIIDLHSAEHDSIRIDAIGIEQQHKT